MPYEPVDLGHPDANREINFLLAELDDTPPAWWYLSFVDMEISNSIPLDQQRPGGPSWLGACYVKASNEVTAVMEAHRLGCNPGGAVATWGPLTDAEMVGVPIANRGRLLSRDEV